MTDEQFIKDGEIIKTLEFCVIDHCHKCERFRVGDSRIEHKDKLMSDALDLIKRKQADVEFYKERANKYEAQVQVLLEQSRSLFEEYEKLRLAAQPYLDEIARECGLNRSKSTALEGKGDNNV